MTTVDALTEVARSRRLEPRAHFELRTSGIGVDAGRDYHDAELPGPLVLVLSAVAAREGLRSPRRVDVWSRPVQVRARGGSYVRWRVEEALLVAG